MIAECFWFSHGTDLRAVCAADWATVYPSVLCGDDDDRGTLAGDRVDVPDAVCRGRHPADPVLRRIAVYQPPHLRHAAVLRPT